MGSRCASEYGVHHGIADADFGDEAVVLTRLGHHMSVVVCHSV